MLCRFSVGEFAIERMQERGVFLGDGRLELRVEIVETHGNGGLRVEKGRVELHRDEYHCNDHFTSHFNYFAILDFLNSQFQN